VTEVRYPEEPATVIWLDSLFAHDDGLLGAVALEVRQAAWYWQESGFRSGWVF